MKVSQRNYFIEISAGDITIAGTSGNHGRRII
jgi:hypothetical protein